jgi:hypothetical protein
VFPQADRSPVNVADAAPCDDRAAATSGIKIFSLIGSPIGMVMSSVHLFPQPGRR